MYSTRDRRFLALAFFVTGATGLVFQIIWTRLLVLSFGYTTYSVSTVVATFMGGLALGSLLGGKVADRARRPPVVYAAVETAVGVLALVATIVLLQFPELVAVARSRLNIPYHGFSVWVALASLVVLLPPTVLMGATLPLLARAVTRAEGTGGRDISPLYALNTLGAAIGSLTTGFVALALLGVTMTAAIAAITNILVGLAVALRFRRIFTPAPLPEQPTATHRGVGLAPLVVGFGVSGFASLSAEVEWTRILAPFLESSVYAYTLVVTLFLFGIAAGTLVGRRWGQTAIEAERGFGLAQLGVGTGTLFGLLCLYPFIATHSEVLADLGAIVRNPSLLLPTTLWFALLLFPSTFFMGLGFPFVAKWASERFQQLGRRTGGIYAINTLSAVLGSVLAGFVLIPRLGVKNALVLSALLSLLTAGWLLLRTSVPQARAKLALALGGIVIAAVVMSYRLSEPDYFATRLGFPSFKILWHQEGPDTAVTVLRRSNRLQLNIGLRPVSGTSVILTPWMTHLPMLYTGQHRGARVLNIGLGVGHTFEVALAYPEAQVTAVELVAGVVDAFLRFRPNAQALIESRRSQLILGDGRNYLLSVADGSLDVLIVDPTPPLYGAGAVNLYTKDFYTIAARKMRPNGRLMLRLPWSADKYSIQMVIRTALEVFPHVTLWAPDRGSGYLLITSPTQLPTPGDATLVARVQNLEEAPASVKNELLALRPRLIADTAALKAQLMSNIGNIPVVTDDHPYLENPLYFPLWMAVPRDAEQ